MNVYQSLRFIIAQVRTFNRPARLFLASTVAHGLVYSAWTLFFNLYLLERAFTLEFLGKANAAPGLAALLLGIPLGLLSDRMGRKSAMLLGASVGFPGADLTSLRAIPCLDPGNGLYLWCGDQPVRTQPGAFHDEGYE